MTLTVVVPAHNEERYIAACLESLIRHATPLVREIIVIDNASTDGTASLASSFPGVRVVSEERKGLLYARQRGLEESTGDLVAYVDADSAVTAGWYPRVEREFAADEQLACLSGPYRYTKSELGGMRAVAAWFFWFVTVPVAARIIGYAAVGGNFVARREALERIGGFDTEISFYGEDTDIARRLSAVGRVKFTTGLSVFTSARRLAEGGMMRTAAIYVMNFLWEVLFHRPYTETYHDVR